MHGRFDRYDESDRQDRRRTGPGFVLASVSCTVTVIVLIVVVAYFRGAPARIAQAYAAMAAPADQALTADMAAYTHSQGHDLAAAESDLRREIKIENAFDAQITSGTFTFPNAVGGAGVALLKADTKRVNLLTLQAQATSVGEMESLDARDQAAGAAVATQVRTIRQALGLPAVNAPLY